jgi:hypothetical protein
VLKRIDGREFYPNAFFKWFLSVSFGSFHSARAAPKSHKIEVEYTDAVVQVEEH